MSLTPTQARALSWLAVAVVAWALLVLLAPVLQPFVVAAVMAYALQPVVDRLHRARWPRWLGAAVVMVLFSLLLLAVVLLIVPVITRQLPLLREQVPLLLEQLNVWLQPWAARLGIDAEVDVNWVRTTLSQLLSGNEGQLFEGLWSSVRIGGSALAALLGHLVLTPIVAYYLLLDWQGLVQRLKAFVPPRWRPATDRFLADTDAVLGQYLHGQLLVMGLLALFYTVALALVGLKLALPIGVFTGLAVFVPYLGFGLGLALGLLAALLQFQSLAGVLWVAAVYGLGQLFESLYLTPRLLGDRIGLHPIAVIFSLMAFGHLFGFVGVLIALPVSAVGLVAWHRLFRAYVGSAMYRSTDSPASDTQDPP
jgi:predicted PurR-regulated permease PerM